MEENSDAWVEWFDIQAFNTPTDYFLYGTGSFRHRPPRQDHRPGLLVAREELRGAPIGIEDRVPHPGVGHLLDGRHRNNFV